MMMTRDLRGFDGMEIVINDAGTTAIFDAKLFNKWFQPIEMEE